MNMSIDFWKDTTRYLNTIYNNANYNGRALILTTPLSYSHKDPEERLSECSDRGINTINDFLGYNGKAIPIDLQTVLQC